LPLYHDKITFNDSNIENVQENTSCISSYIDKTAKENPTYDLFQRIGVKKRKPPCPCGQRGKAKSKPIPINY